MSNAHRLRWVRENAYFRWIDDQYSHGQDVQHWLDAEAAYASMHGEGQGSACSQSPTSKLVIILPRIRITSTAVDPKQFTISKAVFLPDEPDAWNNAIGLPRPPWLDVFRDFPDLTATDAADPCYGTLIVSEDDDWLASHVSRLISLVYATSISDTHWQVPADAFQYYRFYATKNPTDSFTLYTKSGGKTENRHSIELRPTIELRGVPKLARVDLGNDLHQELVSRFDANPHDRLAAACYHLFRSQFDNPVVASAEQDAAAYCACLEAALDVPESGYSTAISDGLEKIYGPFKAMPRWIKGLYAERSVFNHGVATQPRSDHPDDRMKALFDFQQRRTSWDVLRRLCLDVILEKARESNMQSTLDLARMFSPTRAMLTQFFESATIWAETAKRFNATQSVKKILGLTGPCHDEFIDECCRYLTSHRWNGDTSYANPEVVFTSLKAMAEVFYACMKRADDRESMKVAESLYYAAKARDSQSVANWARCYREVQQSSTDLGGTVRRVAKHTAEYFIGAP